VGCHLRRGAARASSFFIFFSSLLFLLGGRRVLHALAVQLLAEVVRHALEGVAVGGGPMQLMAQ
jgi:hypothetical protein